MPLSLSYGFFLFAAEHGIKLAELDWRSTLVFTLMLWMPFLAWELSRKIRAPEEEDAYVTYSRLLGVTGAVAAVLLVQLVSLAAGFALCLTHASSWSVLILPALAWIASLEAGIRFALAPSAFTSTLRPYAELFAVATIASVLLVHRNLLL